MEKICELRQQILLSKEEVDRKIYCIYAQYLHQNNWKTLETFLEKNMWFLKEIVRDVPKKQLWPTTNFCSEARRSITWRKPTAALTLPSVSLSKSSLTSFWARCKSIWDTLPCRGVNRTGRPEPSTARPVSQRPGHGKACDQQRPCWAWVPGTQPVPGTTRPSLARAQLIIYS